ncbi:hypothetical protein BDV12DRAFT_64372 [Aspergillus spectabilis]
MQRVVYELVPLRRSNDSAIKVDVDGDMMNESKKASGWPFGGWKGTLYLGSITSFTVLILNLFMILWASLRHAEHGQAVLYSGNCDRVKEISTGIHFLINILSTFLLSASNFAMQCLSAPTRRDVDRAHATKKWLDIGVPSVRNLWRIPKARLILWLCLVWTSVPLHLFYNSTVYSTIAAYSYDVFVGNSSFNSLTPDEVEAVYDERLKTSGSPNSAQRLVGMSDVLEKLMPSDCISAYATNFQTKYGSLVVISGAFNGSESPINRIDYQVVPTAGDDTQMDPYGWICADRKGQLQQEHPCSHYISDLKSRDEWVVRGHKVDYCLAERTPEKCTLEYSLPLAITVIGANFVKAILIGLAAWVLRGNPLLTVGDAIASFLRSPDETTVGECLLTRDIVVMRARQHDMWRIHGLLTKTATYCLFKMREAGITVPGTFLGSYFAQLAKEEVESEVLKYNAEPKQRWSSLSKTRWVTGLFTYISSLGVCIGLLGYGLAKMGNSEGVWSSGLAAVDTKTMIDALNWPGDLISNTLIANIPQLIFSVLYFMVNSILTNMTLAGEWNNFSLQRKGLRVSTRPQGHQRRTYFLSLPYRYGVPLITLSALLHWLMSQSIFLVRILSYTGWQERDTSYDTMTVGYSPPAIMAVICVGALVPAALIWIGQRRFKSGMPVAGSCSLAIAAACHPSGKTDGEKLEIEYDLLKWGAESYQAGEIGHCTFSNGKVHPPEGGVVCLGSWTQRCEDDAAAPHAWGP